MQRALLRVLRSLWPQRLFLQHLFLQHLFLQHLLPARRLQHRCPQCPSSRWLKAWTAWIGPRCKKPRRRAKPAICVRSAKNLSLA
jgi:hypothetical protein